MNYAKCISAMFCTYISVTVCDAQTIFSDDFESYPDNVVWKGRSEANIIRDPTGQKGGKLLRITIPKDAKPTSGLTKRLPLDESVESACLEYDLYFEKGFEFDKGKLPGLAGGSYPSGCVSADSGFSNRFTMQPEGKLTQYQYFPGKSTNCGEHTTVGRLETEKWIKFRSCIELGTPGKTDGSWQSWINGETIGKKKIKWRNSSAVKISDVMFAAFYSNAAPSKEVKMYFDNIKVYKPEEVRTAPPSAPAQLQVLAFDDDDIDF